VTKSGTKESKYNDNNLMNNYYARALAVPRLLLLIAAVGVVDDDDEDEEAMLVICSLAMLNIPTSAASCNFSLVPNAKRYSISANRSNNDAITRGGIDVRHIYS
jgi:hypothetical protein